MTNVDKDAKVLTLSSGKKIQYDALITTMPLDLTLGWMGKKDLAEGLNYRFVLFS